MPVEPVANLTRVGIGITTAENKVVAAQILPDTVSSELAPRVERIFRGAGRGSLGPRGAHTARVWVEGGLTCEATPVVTGYLLQGLGLPPTTTGTGPYTHTWRLATVLPSRWLSIVHAFNDLTRQFAFGGCAAQRLRLAWDAERDEPLTIDLDLIGAKFLVFNNESVVLGSAGGDAGDPFITPLAKVELPDGTLINRCISGNLEVTLERELRWTVRGSVFPRGHQPYRELRVRGSLTLTFESDDEIRRFLNQVGATIFPLAHRNDPGADAVSLEIFWDPSPSSQFRILMNRVVFTAAQHRVRVGESIVQELDFEAFFDATNAFTVQFTLINNTASYPAGTEIGAGYGE
ncbi:MAG: phage tail tube protein [Armatimonadetes bacterium]|nr:phage tail tube protein [Armatimonadota bacterium]MDW8122700.1 phage tail tube protein [Armatimonadota bacterium]